MTRLKFYSRLGLVLLCTAALLPTAHAQVLPLFDIEVAAAGWRGEFDGGMQAGATGFDLQDDLGFGKESYQFFVLGLKHPVPVLPNVRLQYSQLDTSARATLGQDIEFMDETFSTGTSVNSELDLTQIDGILFYNLWDTVLSLDLGLNFRYLDGELRLSGGGDSASASFSGVLPLLHGRARVDLPFTGFWVGAQVDGVAYSGNRLLESTLSLGWRAGLGLGVEGGWRRYELKLDDLDSLDKSDLDISGPYAGVSWVF